MHFIGACRARKKLRKDNPMIIQWEFTAKSLPIINVYGKPVLSIIS